MLLISARDILQHQAAHSSSKAEAVYSSLVSVSVYTANNEHAACLEGKQKNKLQLLCTVIMHVIVQQVVCSIAL